MNAIDVLRAWERVCRSTGLNRLTWEDAQGRTYALQIDPQLDDGAIRGTVFRIFGIDSDRRAGSVLILPNGEVARAPKFLREVTP